MIVPARRLRSNALVAKVNWSVTSVTPSALSSSEISSVHPRMSRLSSITTSSNQSPPLPTTVPSALSLPPFLRNLSLSTAFHSLRIIRLGAGNAVVQLNDTSSDRPERSAAVTVTANVPASRAAPEMTPVSASMVSPAGRPVADQLMASPSGSEPVTANETVSPTVVDCGPGLVTVGAPPTCGSSGRRACRSAVTFAARAGNRVLRNQALLAFHA